MLLIFDFDGTIADTWDWLADELIACSPRFASDPIDRAGLDRLRGLETSEMLARLGVSPERLPALVEHLRGRAEGAAAGFRLFDGMAGLLHDLHDLGDTLALVSSNSDTTVGTTLGDGLMRLFSHRRCGIGPFDKAAAFKEIVEESEAGGHAVAIGDETRDLDAAADADAGITSVAVAWGYADADLLRSRAGARVADTAEELRHLVEAIRFHPFASWAR